MNTYYKILYYVLVLLIPCLLFAQDIPPFVLNGATIQTDTNCYQLTPAITNQAGSIWNSTQIDLNQSFEAEVSLMFGCSNPVSCFEDTDSGADGIVFAFQPLSTSIGASGGGMGISGVSPSLCIEFDTYPNGNFNDPTYDHVRIFADGDLDHGTANSLSPAMPIIDPSTNAEDCNLHTVNVSWNATTQTMSIYIDCELKTTYSGDIINNIFSGNPNVFWGFTAATGACVSEQSVCIAIPPTFQLNDTTICAGQSVQLSAPDNGLSYTWSPTTGLSNPNIPNPIANPVVTTIYQVTSFNDCNFPSTFELTVSVLPIPQIIIDTTICSGDTITIGANNYFTSGLFTNTFTASNSCDSIVFLNLNVLPSSNAELIDTFCIGSTYTLPNLNIVNTPGTYQVIIPNAAGCDSTISIQLFLNNPDCDDQNCNTLDELNPSNCTCTHTPIAPLNCDDQNCNTTDQYDPLTCTCNHTPITFNCDDGDSNTLDNFISETCTCEHLPIGTVIVPSAFSPNGDGINDVLRPFGAPMLTLDLRIYNRWGQLVFESQDVHAAWDGNFKDTAQEMGVYVYVLQYCPANNPNERKLLQGNITLLR